MLTEEEKWSFDLHGYLILRGAVPTGRCKTDGRIVRYLACP